MLAFFLLLAADTNVWIFTRTDCPIANRYAPEVTRLANEYGKAADFRLIYPESGVTQEKIDAHRKEYQLAIPGAPDLAHALTRRYRVRVTPEVVVERQGRVVYQGRIDDRDAGIGKMRFEPARRDLEEVLASLARGEIPKRRSTRAVGCAVEIIARGWVRLFDGASSRGWLEVTGKPFPASSWRVEDGCLRAFDPGNGYQDLRSEEQFGPDFEFEFEWKIAPGANGGVKYFLQGIEEWTNKKGRQARARGLEYQLFDDASGLVTDRRKFSGALYDVLAPSSLAAKPPGSFNHSRIHVRGGRAEHWLNGVKVASFGLKDPQVAAQLGKRRSSRSGADPLGPTPISLQNHGTPVWFRSLRARNLP